MAYQKYIPVRYSSQYYIYDCLRKWLYPCSKVIYEYFFNIDQLEFSKIDFSNQEKKEIRKFKQMLSLINEEMRKDLFIYPEIKKEDIIKSLSCVPHIVLELTESCNLDCVYCCYGNLYKNNKIHKSKGRKSDILFYLKTLLNLRNQYNNKSDLHITFYGGEPLLCFNIIKECVELVNKLMPEINVSFGMTTNAILLHRYLDYLVEHNFSLFISIDGNRKNNEYRIKKNGAESFPFVERNIEILFKRHHDYFMKKVSFSTVLHHKNNYIDATEFFSRWNKVPLFSKVSSSNAKQNNKYREVSQQHHYTDNEIEKFRKEFPDISEKLFPTNHGNLSTWSDSELSVFDSFCEIQKEENQIYSGKSCFLFSSRVFITIEGGIYLCEKSSRKYLFGKIGKKGIIIYLKRINQYYTSIVNSFNKICVNCYKSCTCSKCFFSDRDEIEEKKCICSKKQAIEEIDYIMNPKK